MGGMTAADMAELAALDTLFMPSTCAIVHTAPGTLNTDGSRNDGTVTTTTVACRFVTGTGMESLLAARLVQEADAVAYLPLGTNLAITDVITVDGVTYQVVDSSEGNSYATSLMATLKLIQ